ncbi:MAG: VWA domain-containing protein [Bdellovibrionota bacterium]
MATYRYTRWDGRSLAFDPKQAGKGAPDKKGRSSGKFPADDVFREFANNLVYGFSAREALEWMMRNGFDLPNQSMRVMGLSDIIQELRKRREEFFSQYNLEKALDEVRGALEDIRNFENQTLSSSPLPERERSRRKNFLENLPSSASEALSALDGYDFLDERAKETYEELRSKFDRIRELENFRDRYRPFFQGEQSLSFNEALDLMDRFNRLVDLERALEQGELDSLDLENLREFFSEQGYESLIILRDLRRELMDAGYLGEGAMGPELTPKGIRRIGAQALRDIYAGLEKDRPGPHETDRPGAGRIVPDSSKPYHFGDPFHVDLSRTFLNALTRGGARVPLPIEPEDFEVFEVEHSTQTATVMLVDMSWSMSWEGRFPAAKKVALALAHLIRTRFPKDHFYTVGFYTRARQLSLKELPEIIWNSGDPFTNLQEGLRLADKLLDRHKNANKQIILVTDGQPTAYSLKGELLVEWPWDFGGISPRASYETLREVRRITKKQIRINTFMLDDSPALVSFINELARINKGKAFYTRPDLLGQYLLVDYLEGKKKRVG